MESELAAGASLSFWLDFERRYLYPYILIPRSKDKDEKGTERASAISSAGRMKATSLPTEAEGGLRVDFDMESISDNSSGGGPFYPSYYLQFLFSPFTYVAI